MGKHYLLNLYDCSFVLLNDEQFLIKLLESAAILSGATVIQTIFKKFDPQGVTVICLLAESHISIHTWPEEKQRGAYNRRPLRIHDRCHHPFKKRKNH